MTSRRILFLVSAHNSLSQRAWIELTERGHDVTVAVVDSSAAMEAAVHEHDPELIVCPMLKKIIPASIWSQHCCLVVHPGPLGDRGPSSLDWAVELDQPTWGVTVLQANDDVDGGDVWATRTFPVRGGSKSGLYRHEVRRAAIAAIVEAVGKFDGRGAPAPLAPDDPRTIGRARPLMTQDVRAIDWPRGRHRHRPAQAPRGRGPPGRARRRSAARRSTCSAVTRRARCAARRGRSSPGATAPSAGPPWTAPSGSPRSSKHVDAGRYGAQAAGHARGRTGRPGRARTRAARCRCTRRRRCGDLPRDRLRGGRGGVGYLRFAFHNGAMSTEQCRRLQDAYALRPVAARRPRSSCCRAAGTSSPTAST